MCTFLGFKNACYYLCTQVLFQACSPLKIEFELFSLFKMSHNFSVYGNILKLVIGANEKLQALQKVLCVLDECSTPKAGTHIGLLSPLFLRQRFMSSTCQFQVQKEIFRTMRRKQKRTGTH